MPEQQERRQGWIDLHEQFRGMNEKLDKSLELSTRIETALWPDKGQPGKLTDFEDRIGKLESAKNWAIGAFAVVSSLFGIHVGVGHK